MELLALYDIANPRRLRRVARIMERYGIRVQKSVFECNLSDSALQDMKSGVTGIMDLGEDTLRIYPLLSDSRSRQTIVGTGEMVDFPPCYIL